tara:strand:- start:3416 stop:4576 length:1161 start_codon:yes stop_codon:yes gene_type:complete
MTPIGTTTITNNAQSRFGFSALSEIGAALSGLGVDRPLICSDTGLREAGLIDRLLSELPTPVNASVFDGTPPNPTETAINDAAALFRNRDCDGVISIGGGSSLDLGKGVALRVTHPEPLQSYTTQNMGIEKIGDVAPMVAIPTTAGTGSEVARASVVILDNGEKRVVASPKLIPRLSILDPELTLSLPPYLTAATGMDAVTHCIEAVISPAINPPADAIALDGIERALGDGALRRAVADGSDRDARWTMMLVSTEGAMAFSKGLGAVHAMSHACGKDLELKLHHGTLNAVLLPPVLRFNYEHARDKYPTIARAMGLPPDADLAATIAELNAELGLPEGLAAMGITIDMVPDLAEHAVDDMCTATNPAPLDRKGYEHLFEMALSGLN